MKKMALVLGVTSLFLQVSFAQESRTTTGGGKAERRYTYHETDGVVVYYETKNKEAYRKLLPEIFDMPDRLYVHAFISDFYKMKEGTTPYKEAAVFLLGKYENKEIWHCITMPVTSDESRIMGIRGLGLPKIMGDVNLVRKDPVYTGSTAIKSGHTMQLQVDAEDYEINKAEEELLKELSVIPKMNIRRGKVVEMFGAGAGGSGKSGTKRSIIDLAQMAPRRMTLKFGEGKVTFGDKKEVSGKGGEAEVHPFVDLEPSKMLGAYYLKNTFTYSLGVK
ncbi:acetoacetate decarboxylase family protein [Pontiellaceae bacterium B12227]|nr:acetoacetate decarboxylase family protein [Pontiellaceae bacterium B12227]